jgi:SAM-dependent methyltransferase
LTTGTHIARDGSGAQRESTIATQRCPSCSSVDLTAFHSVAATPVTCAAVFDTPEEARAVPLGRVELKFCNSCTLVFNPLFDSVLAEIGARYESSQAASAHFSQFARALSRSWVDRYALVGKTVLEIGCGHGEFLRLMLGDGAARAIGLDPLASAAACDSDPALVGLSVRPQRFDELTLDVAADAAVCRHTLEHVPQVNRFLTLLAEWSRRGRGRVVLFEVPAAERVFSEAAFWDVYYEHCSYFTVESLEQVFWLAGFNVKRVEHVYGDQYLILEATVGGDRVEPLHVDFERVKSDCLEFGKRAEQAIARCDNGLRVLAASGRPVVLWQGAAKTVGFLSALGQANLVQSAVDLSVQRQGKFLPGSGLAVHAPEQLRHIDPEYLVLMNPVYFDEVQASLDQLGVAARLLTVNELCDGELGRVLSQ